MGIPSIYRQIIKKYNSDIIISKITNEENIKLFFDFNACIHYVLNLMNNEKTKDNNILYNDFEREYINNIIKYLIDIIKNVNKNGNLKEVYICTDGVVPRSKMIQQRLRRFKNFNPNCIFDRNAISPGTNFMKNLSININEFVKNNEFENIKFVYFDDTNEGEGEQIVFKNINKNNDNCLNVIYSLDADVIMLSLLNCNKNVYLLREKQEFEKNDIICENDELYHFLNINKLRKYIYEMNEELLSYINKSELMTDLIFLYFFLGNDFVPHLKEINIYKNGLELLNDNYKISIYKYKTSLVNIDINNNITINSKVLIDILSNISNNENYLVKKNSNRFDLKIINYEDVNWKKKHNKYYFKYESIDKVCKNYVESLKWTIEYYVKNEVPHWNWYYKYMYGPVLSEVVEYLRRTDINNVKIEEENERVSVDQQLFMILPKESSYLMKEEYRKYIDNELEEYFPIKYRLNKVNCHAKWQHTPILPDIDINMIKKYID